MWACALLGLAGPMLAASCDKPVSVCAGTNEFHFPFNFDMISLNATTFTAANVRSLAEGYLAGAPHAPCLRRPAHDGSGGEI